MSSNPAYAGVKTHCQQTWHCYVCNVPLLTQGVSGMLGGPPFMRGEEESPASSRAFFVLFGNMTGYPSRPEAARWTINSALRGAFSLHSKANNYS